MEKAPDAFRTISEVAEGLDVPQHVLRFWETRFSQIKPMKRSGGRRYYRPEDVDLLRGIRHLLYGQGYTIRGVQRILREQGVKAVQNWQPGAMPPPSASVDSEEMEHEDALHEAVAEGFAEDFEAEEGDDSDESAASFPNAVSSWVDVAGRMRRPGAMPDVASSMAEPSPRDEVLSERLKSALDDLLDCRRLLDVAFQAK
ncbi:MAG: MerR family transcriptional regulator [Xanthobacteraceae bacterium]